MNHRMWSLNARELRDLLLVIAVLTWALALRDTLTAGMFYRSGPLKGSDFLHFYVLGSLANDGRVDLLYDIDGQRAEQERLVPASKGIWFVPVYGPQTALLFAGFARLPYLPAAALWAVLTMALYGLCVWLIWRRCPLLLARSQVVTLAALGFPPFSALVLHGQTSAVPLLCATLGYAALRSGRDVWAGVALGSMVLKPQLGMAVAVVMLACREWRVVGGAVAAVAAQFGVAAAVLGVGALRAYMLTLIDGPRLAQLLEPWPFQMHSLRAFWSLLVPKPSTALALYILCSALALAVTIRVWRTSAPLELRYSALLLATLLVAPHVGIYEVVLLAPAFLLTASVTERTAPPVRRLFRLILSVAFIIYAPGSLAAVTRVQVSVLVLGTWLSALAWAAGRTSDDALPRER